MTLLPNSASANASFELRLLGQFPLHNKELKLNEPSGLTVEADARMLWAVSDETARLFRLDFTGRIERAPIVNTADLEGIAAQPDGTLAVVRESSNEVILYASSGAEVTRRAVADMDGYEEVRADFEHSPDGKGLEGITADADGTLYVLKEGVPRLMLAISGDLSEITAVHRLTREAGFHSEEAEDDDDLDVSGIAHDPVRGRFWIVSDSGKRLFLYDPEKRDAQSVELFRRKDGEKKSLKNAEGIALHPDGDMLFVITDDKKKSLLVIYMIVEQDD